MKSQFYVDIHCHPSIKAYARSYLDQPGIQSNDPRSKTSLWHYDSPSIFDKIKNYLAGITSFIQSDASSLLKGKVAVVFLSFYTLEKGFFINKIGKKVIADALAKIATEFGQERIDHLKKMTSYWDDLRVEMKFLQQKDGSSVIVDGKKVQYKIASSFNDIEQADLSGELGKSQVFFVPTIEGTHIFDQVMDCHEPWDKHPEGIPEDKLFIILQRVRELREGRDGILRPIFITFAHHFWNGLCGHARSIPIIFKRLFNQENGIEKGFTEAGRKVVKALLEEQKDNNGSVLPPVYIDIKHMSRKSRLEYFELLDTRFSEKNIPVIISHAGVTGLSKPDGSRDTEAAKEYLFMEDPINFYDDEILRVYDSSGLFGIQLDSKRIGSGKAVRYNRWKISKSDTLYSRAKLVWNQVRHIAELLDRNNRYAWGIQSIGTDFDGFIDPISGYWTATEIHELNRYLLKYVHQYLHHSGTAFCQQKNRNISAEEVVDRIMTSNALNFLSRIYK